MIAFGAFVVLAFGRSEGSTAAAGGNVRTCAALTGEPARACYAREVGRELAAAGGGAPRALAASASSTVTFAAADTAALLCDLHIRVGATDATKASWTTWVAQ
ncbi:hypothetical protein [Solirubrobacter deserti]|uniref:Uncharacterized protein n=1 Tax=Solirubrobacter deserti TaxID=2282478 RepID=A0ABT4RTP4_9ACTN|nr:hypothetical protein [Solirubrobacter deserti]MDA0141952.1 hypothetical protein [Solirubrobacter deserti]